MRKYRQRIHYTETDKALMWDRWRKGDSSKAFFGQGSFNISL
jgi:hypothetical protein